MAEIPPKVFISYSHDSPEHEAGILAFSEKLRGDGIDTRIDQYVAWPEESWPHWMERHIREADFVLLVCTETYFRRVTGREEPGIGFGVCWEAHLIYNELYTQKLNNKKFIPIFFDEARIELIPPPLSGYNFYVVNTEIDYSKLYRILTNQPAVKLPPLGSIHKLSESTKSIEEANEAKPESKSRESHKYFISYAHGDANDENLARFLHEELTTLGHFTFIDIGMKTGVDWLEEIRERIKWCDYLVLLLSKSSMRSEMVLREVRMARANQRTQGTPQILPIRMNYEGALAYELDLYLGHLHHATWRKKEDSEHVLTTILDPSELNQSEIHRRSQLVVTDAMRVETSEEPSVEDRPDHAMDPRLLTVGDVVDDDPGYISRPEDQRVLETANEVGETIVIKAPNQMGKSSLLARYLHACQNAGRQTALVDFAIFGEEELSSYPQLLSTLAWALNDVLEINEGIVPEIKTQPMMVSYIRKNVLGQITGPLTIAFDEVDRVMGQSYQEDFFTMLRSFHNSRRNTRWADTDLALVISTEPYLLIEESGRSPFNVVTPIELKPFSMKEYLELNGRYENLLSAAELKELYDLLQGHPYLTRLAYYHLKGGDEYSFDELIERADEERGPFGEHLRAKLADLQDDPGLLEGTCLVLDPEREPSRDMAYRLYGAGLITIQRDDHAVPANLLYARYFRRVLHV